ncbi:MAG: regulatory protein NosR, partial [Gammaproteobacteria bacterium]
MTTLLNPLHILRLLVIISILAVCGISYAMPPVTEAQQTETIQLAFPTATRISDKTPIAKDQPEIKTIYKGDDVIGYAFESNDIVNIPAYSGKPVNVLVAMDTLGEIKVARVLAHQEPILLVGIPERHLFDFASQLLGAKVTEHIVVGQSGKSGVRSIDSLSGATVTVMVVNEVIMRSAKKVARLLGIAGMSAENIVLPATINPNVFTKANWEQLMGDGSIRHLELNYAEVDKSFEGTEAEWISKDEEQTTQRKQKLFIDLYYAPLNIPTIGKNILGDNEFDWLMSELKPGDQAIAVMGLGDYSFKGNGFVRGGIFDRFQVQQEEKSIIFRDSDYHRINDIYIDGVPEFDEKVIFIIRDKYKFDIGTPWQAELLVRRQIGALDSVFTRFFGDYQALEQYIIRPIQPVYIDAEPEALWVSVWRNKIFQITVLIISLVMLFTVIILQDYLDKHPRFLQLFRKAFLIYT